METPPPTPRIGFGRLVAILLIVTAGALVWRVGLVGPGIKGDEASASDRRAADAGSQGHESGPSGAQVKVERGPMGTTDSTALVDPAGDARTVQRYIDLGLPIYCGGGHGNFVALTFDDGPGAYTQRTLDMLRAAGDTATFFLVGRNLDAWASLPKQERALGAVGDHTWNHIALTGVSPSEQQREIERTKGAEEALIGGPLMLFRPPLASRNSEVDRLVHDLGLLEIIWTVDSRDSAGVGPALTYQNVIEGLKPGAIILMHENRGATLQDLPSILDAVARAGLRTVTVPQLLRLDPPTPEQVRRSAGEGACVPG